MTGGRGGPPGAAGGPAEAAAAAFGLDPAALTPVASAYRAAAGYRAGGVLLKPYRYGERQLYYATTALEHMARRDFPGAPRLVRARWGEPYVSLGGQLWYATTWLDGRPPRFPQELWAAARALAAFHLAAEGCYTPWSPSRSWPGRWRRVAGDIAELAALAAGRAGGAGAPGRVRGGQGFDATYAAAAPAFLRRAEAALAALAESDYPRLEQQARQGRRFCHRDLTPANLLVAPGGRVCMVDPDTWGADLRLHDIVRLLLGGAGSDLTAVAAALDAYGPLDPAERRLLPAALLLPREFWWAGVCQYRRPTSGVDPERLLADAIAGAPARDACVRALS